MSITYFII